MSPGARILLGVVLIVIALGFLALVPSFVAAGDAFPPQTSYALGALAVFCGLGALACFSRASHPVTIRVIGAAVFSVSLWYVVSEALTDAPAPARAAPANPLIARIQRRGRPGLVNSLVFFGCVGLPAGFTALLGRYPDWGRHSKAFGSR